MLVLHGVLTAGFLRWRLLVLKSPLVWFIARNLEIPFRYVMIVKSNCLYPVLSYCVYLVYVLDKDIIGYAKFYVIDWSVYTVGHATSQDPHKAPSSTPARMHGSTSSRSSPAASSQYVHASSDPISSSSIFSFQYLYSDIQVLSIPTRSKYCRR